MRQTSFQQPNDLKTTRYFFIITFAPLYPDPRDVKNAVRTVKGARELFGSSQIHSSKFDLEKERKCQV